MKLFQFTHLFRRQGLNLLYSSRNNSFLQLSDGLYAFLETLRKNNGITGVPPEFASDIDYLIDQSVVIETADADIDYINALKIFHRNVKSQSSLNSNNVNLYSSSVFPFPNNSQDRISISYLLDFGRRYAHDAEGISPVRPNAL